MNEEKYWKKALEVSNKAIRANALIPLETELDKEFSNFDIDFEVRRLKSKLPKEIKKIPATTNPFQPWDKRLEVNEIGNSHVLILNKYPVQIGHMLLITKQWAPQDGWITKEDWKALLQVDMDTSGLWFFNSCYISGASQPHRHIQLLRRKDGEIICPRNEWFLNRIKEKEQVISSDRLIKSISVERRNSNIDNEYRLNLIYEKLCLDMQVGTPNTNSKPLKPYNLLITKNWMALVVRGKDSFMGFDINALGFAGYILETEDSNRNWIALNGPSELLRKLV